MRDINNLVKRYANLMEVPADMVTSDEYLGNGSFYLLPNGEYLNCRCDYGTRCYDHRTLFGATKIDCYKSDDPWKKLQCNYQIIRIVGEVPCMMIHKNQKITTSQKREMDNLINNYGFEVEYYEN